MAFPTRSTRSAKKAPDTRALNHQPNHLIEAIVIAVFSAGVELGAVSMPQGEKLSEKGNITFKGGIKDGWELGETWMDALSKLSFTANGQPLTVSAATGVHTSGSGNPTVGHFGVIDLTDSRDGSSVKYRVEVYATWLVKKGSYSLSLAAYPQGMAARGPQVVGEVNGLVVAPRD